MDEADMLLAASNGGELPQLAHDTSDAEAEAAEAEAVAAEVLGMPEGLDDAHKARIMNLYASLQECIDERSASLGELIERTVSMHKQIQQDVAGMLAQDKEEDALVSQTVLRTEQTELELSRNPEYRTFLARRKAAEEKGSARLEDWPLDTTLAALGNWRTLIALAPADCEALLESRRQFREGQRGPDGGGGGGGGEGEAGAALQNEEVHFLHQMVRLVKAQPQCGTVDALVAKLIQSKALCREHLTPAVVHGRCCYLAVTPLAAAARQVELRCFVLRGRLCAVEQRSPHVLHKVPDVAAMQAAVAGFVAKVQQVGRAALGETFALDAAYAVDTGETHLVWIQKMSCEVPRTVAWEDLCDAAAAPEGAPPIWHLKAAPSPVLAAPSEDAATFDLLVAERQHLPCWRAAPDAAAAAVTKPAEKAASAKHRHVDPAAEALAQEPSPAAQAATAMLRPEISTTLMTTVAVAATSFLAGYLASRKQ